MSIPVVQAQRAREQLSRLVRPAGAIKQADLGDSEASFEQAMASLAHATLSDKAPKLTPYSMGFQLMKKNEEGTRAVGIQAYKVAEQWLFVPIFFINGAIKGSELLYIKNQDLFVPLQDDWIDYILGRQPLALGDGVDRNLSRLGVQSPHLYQLTRPPLKYASADAPWRRRVFEDFAYLAVTSPQFPGPDVPGFLKAAGHRGRRALLQLCASYPALVPAIDRFYPDLLTKQAFERWALGDAPRHYLASMKVDKQIEHGEDAWETAGRFHRYGKKVPDKRKSLLDLMAGEGERTGNADKVPEKTTKVAARALDRPGGTDIQDFGAEERRTLLKQRYVVRDDRNDNEVAMAYDTVTPLKLLNPDRTNLYEILVRPDRFVRCLVIARPVSREGRNEFCTVVDLATKRWVNLHASRVWALSEATRESFQDFYDKLENGELRKDSTVMLITPSGQATVPFRVAKVWGDADAKDGSFTVDAWYNDYAAHGRDRPEYYVFRGSRRFTPDEIYPVSSKIRFTGRPGGMITRHLQGEVWMPQDYKVIVLEPADRLDAAGDSVGDGTAGAHSEPQPLEPGDLADVQLLIQGHTYPLRVSIRGKDVTIDEARQPSKEAAVVELVTRHNLREKTALAILAKAQATGSAVVRIKKADNANYIDSAPNAPPQRELEFNTDPLTGGTYPAQFSTAWEEPVTDITSRYRGSEHLNPMIPPDHVALQNVMRAVQTGEKEVFDTAMLGTLLRMTNDDNLIDRHLGNILKGMSALGRVLFAFYWHQDIFAERYGKSDLPEIEDGLRNAFDACGRIALELKDKQVHAQLSEGISSGSDNQSSLEM